MDLLQFCLLNMCVYVCMWVILYHTHVMVYMWKPEDNSQELVLFPPCHHVGPSSRTQVVRLGCRCCFPLSHLTGPSGDSKKLNVR